MPPVNKKKMFKHVNIERKLERKKLREQTILKAAVDSRIDLQQDINTVDDLKEDALSNFNFSDSKPPDNHSANQAPTLKPTVSIAVPASILDNAQSFELKTFLAGHIARAACLYCVDEIVVFNDLGSENIQVNSNYRSAEDSCKQFVQFLQYMECPQYLRKHLFTLNKDLQYAALLYPIDAPHHLQHGDDHPFREGVVSHHLLKNGKGCYVNVGLLRDVCVQKALVPGTRVTVHLQPKKESSKKRYGEVVSSSLPRQLMGVYWGYSVRLASSLSEVFTKAPYQEGYDLTLGTSVKGIAITDCADSDFQGFQHVLIVFGGRDGLESALDCDENLNIDNVSLLFDKYLNTCPNQGSRTIRTEEAVLISLALIVPRLATGNKN